jgi:carbon-monoxide dehydrogenase iron sulfur subunit
MICVDIAKCTGCRTCEVVCAFFHTGKVGKYLSRIKAVNIYETGIDGPVVCQQCEEKFCMECPVDALSIGNNGQIVHSPTLCILCGACERNCPIGAIEIFGEYVYVCDLCGGNPKCVKACPEGALQYNPDKTVSLNYIKEMENKYKNKDKDENKTPSEKRHYYIKEKGSKLRKIWRGSHE